LNSLCRAKAPAEPQGRVLHDSNQYVKSGDFFNEAHALGDFKKLFVSIIELFMQCGGVDPGFSQKSCAGFFSHNEVIGQGVEFVLQGPGWGLICCKHERVSDCQRTRSKLTEINLWRGGKL
jgi:hypothetical protein